MSEEKQETPFFELADQYINLANDLAKKDGTANVGTALRYAAARYNTFEASLSTDDLDKDQDKLIDMLCDDFREMLKVNMQDYIQRIAKQAEDS
jgi:lauroyl/myristoyl acyltransferase